MNTAVIISSICCLLELSRNNCCRGQERGSAVSFDMAASASVYSDVSFSDFSSSAYRGILDVLRYATDDNRDSGIPWLLNSL